MPKLLTRDEIRAILADELPDWSYEDGCLVRSLEPASYAAGIALVDRVAAVAEELNHHPDIDIRYTSLTFRLATHVAGGVTRYDVRLAERMDALLE